MSGIELFTIPALTAAGEATAFTLADAVLLGSTAFTIMGQQQAASAEQDAMNKAVERTQKISKIEAGQQRAAAQRKASEERRRAGIASSNLQAAAAASGMSASDVGAVGLEEDIAGEGVYRSLYRLYEGEQAAQNIEYQGKATAADYRYKGKLAKSKANMDSMSTIMQFGASSLDKYGSKMFSGNQLSSGKTLDYGNGYIHDYSKGGFRYTS